MEGCRKFDAVAKNGINMAMSKETLRVVSDTREMMKRCLMCKFFGEKCDRTWDMVDFLSDNLKANEGDEPI